MNEITHSIENERKMAVILDKKDNVAVALADVKKGQACSVQIEGQEEKIVVSEDIMFGHKLALTSLNEDDPVIKYGEQIGKMKAPIDRGGWIHNHNMYCERGGLTNER